VNNPSADAETSLVIQAQQGDRSAFGELVCHYHRDVVNIVYRMCADVQLAEDAAQDAFIRAWLNLPSFQAGTSLRNWLYRIAVNAALDMLRRKQHQPLEEFETMMLADPEPGPETELVKREQAILIEQAINALTPAVRAVLVLREYGELSYKEIAAALDIPIGTVMSRLNYARNRLRTLLEPHLLHSEVDHV